MENHSFEYTYSAQQQQEVEEFDPYAPLIIVPNDYEEGDEIEIVE